MRVRYRLKNQMLYHEDMVDVMNVAGKLRWADSEGNQNTTPDAEVIGGISENPLMVVVDREGDTCSFQSVKVVAKQGECVYLSGPNFVDRISGEIVRIRDQTV